VRSSTLAKHVAELTLTKKANDVVIMDLRTLSPVADFFVICSAESDIQARAIADAVEEGMEKEGSRPWHKEKGSLHWIVLDYVDVVLHIFHKHTRTFYNLEKLWGDARITSIGDPAKPPVRSAARQTRRSTGPAKLVKKAAP
jgi:ribosome-associated protein